MSCKNNDPPCSLKCRYKGIENFFRRIAFNLGNTPSQTEVKIISCIPVDVTDLQQRILSLEQQVREAEHNKNTFNTEFLTYPATVISNGFLKHHLGFTSSIDNKIDNLSPKLQKTNNMVVPKTCQQTENDDYIRPEVDIDQLQKKIHCTKYYNTLTKKSSSYYEKDNGTNYSTFKDPYLNEMAQKQYRSSVVYKSKDLLSSFSSPICRESSDYHEPTLSSDDNTYTSYFKNIDKKFEKDRYIYLQDTKQVYTMRNDNQYDTIPVKEKAEAKIIYNKKKINKLYNNMQMRNPKSKMHSKSPYKCLDKTQHIYQKKSLSNSCYIDCGKIYPKKNAEVEKKCSEYKEHQASQINNTYQEIIPQLKLNETEESLRQIKSILQTVLQEVKATSNDLRKDAQINTDDKYANVVKPITNDNCSYYGNMYSKNAAYSAYQPAASLYPVLPIQPLQYLPPLMVQPPAYHQHCNRVKNITERKREHLNTTGTNTDHIDNNESGKLIKEIYKSLNLNLNSEDFQEKKADVKNSKDNLFKNDVQIYNTRPQKFTSISEHSKKFSPKGILVNNSLNMLDKETEVDYDEETTSMTESYVSDSATTKTLATITEKKKKSNFFTNILKSFKIRRDKNIIPKKEIKFKEDVETIEDSNSESEEYSIISKDKRMPDYRYAQAPRRNFIKFEKKPKSIYRYYRNPFLEKDYREILADRHQFNTTSKTPVYWHNYDTRPVFLNDPDKFNRTTKPKYVEDKVIYSQANNKAAGLNWLQKYKSNVQKCGQNWKSAVLES